MNIEKIKNRKTEKKSIVVSLRITQTQSDWLSEKDYSPNAILQESILELQKSDK